MNSFARLSALCSLALVTVASAQTTPSFTLTPSLALPDGYTHSSASSINGSGQVVGNSYIIVDPYTYTPTLWTEGTASVLPVSATYTAGCPTAINATGTVIVGGNDSAPGDALVWTWNGSAYDTVTALPNLPSPGSWSWATGVNAAGVIVGAASHDGDTSSSAVVWKWTGSSYTITSLDPGGKIHASANAINTSGTVAGNSSNGTTSYAVAWTWDGTDYSAAIPLDTLGGLDGRATGINDAGTIVGNSSLSGGGMRAAVWTWGGSDYSVAQINDPFGLTVGNSSAIAINSSGMIVGSFDSSTGQHAFFYDGGTMFDLNACVTGLGGLTLQYASGINDAGQIVGSATDGSNNYAFLLTPTAIPEPATYAALLGLGALGLAIVRRRLNRA